MLVREEHPEPLTENEDGIALEGFACRWRVRDVGWEGHRTLSHVGGNVQWMWLGLDVGVEVGVLVILGCL